MSKQKMNKSVLDWYQLLNTPDWSYILIFFLFFPKYLAGTDIGYFKKKLSYQSGTGIRFKADFPLIHGRYVPGIDTGISQVYIFSII
jgi:hypothetical protein